MLVVDIIYWIKDKYNLNSLKMLDEKMEKINWIPKSRLVEDYLNNDVTTSNQDLKIAKCLDHPTRPCAVIYKCRAELRHS